ncbi:MAG: SUMF1/EgtB/PvdO family nonheme iron enzyme [Magnetococcus sp. YQC-5]
MIKNNNKILFKALFLFVIFLFLAPLDVWSASLDVDKSGTVDATDGVLILRRLNGAATIDTGVILPSGQTNATVRSLIDSMGSGLDIDKSGTVDATDGVLMLRRLNGASTIDTGVVLPAGQSNSTILAAIDKAAATSIPVFKGLSLVTANNSDKATLAWFQAQDDVTPAGQIMYQLHQSKDAHFTPSTATLVKTFTNEYQTVLDKLEAGTTYHFLMVAVDEAGNQSTEWEYKTLIMPTLPVVRTDIKLASDEELALGKPAATIATDQLTFTKTQNTKPPELNSVLVGNDGAGGYLKKVKSVTDGGNQLVVQTTNAALFDDVIKQGTLSNTLVMFDVNKLTNSQTVPNSSSVVNSAQGDMEPVTKEVRWKDDLLTATQVNYLPDNNRFKIEFNSQGKGQLKAYDGSSALRSSHANAIAATKVDTDGMVQISAKTYNMVTVGNSLNLTVQAMITSDGDTQSYALTSLALASANFSGTFQIVKTSAKGKYITASLTWTPGQESVSDSPYVATLVATAMSGSKKNQVSMDVNVFVEKEGQKTKDSSGSISSEINLKFEPSLNVVVNKNLVGISDAAIYLQGNLDFKSLLKYEFTQAKKLESDPVKIFSRSFKSFYMVGVVPVVQEVTFSLAAQFTGEAKAVVSTTALAEAHSEIKLGLRYGPGGWEPIKGQGFSRKITIEGKAEGEVTAEVRLIPEVQVAFYREAVVGISIEPYLKGELGAEALVGYDVLQGEMFGGGYQMTKANVTMGIDVQTYAELKILTTSVARFPDKDKYPLPLDLTWPLFSLPTLTMTDNYVGGKSHLLEVKVKDGIRNEFQLETARWLVQPPSGLIVKTSKDPTRTGSITDPAVLETDQTKKTAQDGFTFNAEFFPGTDQVEYTVIFIGNGVMGGLGRQYVSKIMDYRDNDKDGMPNVWEDFHHLDKNNASDASSDSDGDGFTALQEYQYGTKPKDANSFPSLAPINVTVARADTSFTLKWDAVVGAKSYNIYMATAPGVTKANYATKPNGKKVEASATSYTLSGLNDKTKYYFVITSVNAAAESIESSEVAVTTFQAAFTVLPVTGDTSTSFQFTAAGSTDLQVQWDWDGDGTWDTSYSSEKTINRSFTKAGNYTVKMQAKNPEGLTATTSQSIQVSASNTTTATGAEGCPAFDQLGMRFKLIPAGQFTMGCSSTSTCFSSKEMPEHTVTLSKSFYMLETEVTQAQWKSLMGSNPAFHTTCGDNCPVEKVSYWSAADYANELNRLCKLPGKSNMQEFRLPTEAEWEYAARAGTTTAYTFGDSSSNLNNYAWYKTNSGSTTHPVAQKLPNPWGLYDMSGNVFEWVLDCYSAYTTNAAVDPKGPFSCVSGVIRGGSFNFDAVYARSAFRDNLDQSSTGNNLGFRIVLAPAKVARYP